MLLNEAINKFALAYIAMRGEEHNAELFQQVPVAFREALYPCLSYEGFTDPVFQFLMDATPGAPLRAGDGWSPLLQAFFNGARYLAYARDYGANQGGLPVQVARVYLDVANLTNGTPRSYLKRYNKQIHRYLMSGSALLEANIVSEWDSMVCFAMETVRLFLRGEVVGGDQLISTETECWFEDLVPWLTMIYTREITTPRYMQHA